MNNRNLANHIVNQWENHDKYRVIPGEQEGEPDEVVLAKALLKIDEEYGCEVMDPYGTIWQQAAAQQEFIKRLGWALVNVLDGVKEHDIMGMTGLSKEDCKKIHEVRLEAEKVI